MKAIVYKKFGDSDVLQLVEQPIPTLKADQVLVRVKAFSINPMDWKIRKGEMTLMSGSAFPKHTGTDFSGTVEATGSSVNGLKKGDKVFGVVKNMMKEGASAEYVAVTSSLVWKKPENISYPQAASIPVVGTAAVTALEKMGDITSQKILIIGASGGFGMFLLQLLKQRGAKVTAVTSSQGAEYAKKWGAHSVIDYTKTNVLSNNALYDTVIDLSGKIGYDKAKQIMKAKALYLNPTPKPIEIPMSLLKNLLRSKKHRVILSNPSTKYTDVLLGAVKNGLLIEVNKVFQFDQFREAYQYAEHGGYSGKVVIQMT
ncbi:NADP-dependent oxidoreductase [Anditalea andensis]|uniref:Enoyl reductase (ER) domain-containing protein n=1 Tax=Anditalea andensis TaxID=1048983 RepID=A0A074LKG6_9BACT|nr:NADP-dependent oxidoreductase [Anditalea andensis]KEO74327.1 hypothetical protein EL17_09375 [Anditalea andensis]